MQCEIEGCHSPADPDGGAICKRHQVWTAAFMTRCLTAIETAITDDEGLDGLAGEAILRESGHWKARPEPPR